MTSATEYCRLQRVPDPEYILGGYVVVVPARSTNWMGAVVPDPFLTISQCLTTVLGPEYEIWWLDFSDAKDARDRCAPDAELMAVGFAERDVEGYLVAADFHSNDSFELLKKRHTILSQDVFGFEIVGGDDQEAFHSWHCHGYASETPPAFGIELDDRGLLGSYDDARTVLEWILSQPRDNQPRDVPWVVAALATVP